ncbi:MAG: hypothetical protein Tsb002_01440 [Wenzhouxiangellaceae bacterium]
MDNSGNRTPVTAETEYSVSLQSQPSGNPGNTNCTRPNWYKTEVLEPVGNNNRRLKRTTYYSIADRDSGVWKKSEYGLPLKKDDSLNISEAGGKVYLSEQIANCNASGNNCTDLRKTYLRYAIRTDSAMAFCEMGDAATCSRLDTQLVARHTVFVDDGNSYKGMRLLDYDGLGHMREQREYASSAFKGDSGVRTTIQEYNSDVTTSDVTLGVDSITIGSGFYNDLPGFNEPWLLNLRELSRVSGHGGPDIVSRYLYNAQGSIRYQQDGDAGNDSLYTHFLYTPDGRPDETQQCFGQLGLQSCNINAPDTIVTKSVYTGGFPDPVAGLLETRKITSVDEFEVDQSPDARGLITSSRTGSEVETLFTYDDAYRIASRSTAGLATIQFTYTNATTSTPASVNVTQGDITVAVNFDGLGRAVVQTETLPTQQGFSAERSVKLQRDALGNIIRILTTDGALNNDIQQEFDSLHRLTKTINADDTDTLWTYTGERLQTFSHDDDGSPLVTYIHETEFDAFGRVYSQFTDAGHELLGTPLDDYCTLHGYDNAGRLISRQRKEFQCTASTTPQSRAWSYDNRGFLEEQSMPEKGQLLFKEHHRLGNPGVRLTCQPSTSCTLTQYIRRLDFDYDKKGRLLSVTDPAIGTMQAFVYGATGCQGNHGQCLGQLISQTRHNWFGGNDYPVTDVFAYSGLSGALSDKTTTVAYPDTAGILQTRSFHQGYSYTTLGETASITYPDCQQSDCTASNPDPANSVSYDYAYGRLIGLSHSDLLSADFNYNGLGMLTQIKYGGFSAAETNYEADSTGSRLGALAVRDGTIELLRQNYSYNDIGNITSINPWGDLLYDGAARLIGFESTSQNIGLHSIMYAYDAFDNLEVADDLSTPILDRVMAADPENNQLFDINGQNVQYDLAGNIIDDGCYLYAYDALDVVQSVMPSSTQPECQLSVDHLYDANNLRVLSMCLQGCEQPPPVPPPPPPVALEFNALDNDPSTPGIVLEEGESLDLVWLVANADSCTASNDSGLAGWSGTVTHDCPEAGCTQSLIPFPLGSGNSSVELTLSCENSESQQQRSINVFSGDNLPEPQFNVQWDGHIFAVDQTATFSWSGLEFVSFCEPIGFQVNNGQITTGGSFQITQTLPVSTSPWRRTLGLRCTGPTGLVVERHARAYFVNQNDLPFVSDLYELHVVGDPQQQVLFEDIIELGATPLTDDQSIELTLINRTDQTLYVGSAFSEFGTFRPGSAASTSEFRSSIDYTLSVEDKLLPPGASTNVIVHRLGRDYFSHTWVRILLRDVITGLGVADVKFYVGGGLNRSGGPRGVYPNCRGSQRVPSRATSERWLECRRFFDINNDGELVPFHPRWAVTANAFLEPTMDNYLQRLQVIDFGVVPDNTTLVSHTLRVFNTMDSCGGSVLTRCVDPTITTANGLIQWHLIDSPNDIPAGQNRRFQIDRILNTSGPFLDRIAVRDAHNINSSHDIPIYLRGHVGDAPYIRTTINGGDWLEEHKVIDYGEVDLGPTEPFVGGQVVHVANDGTLPLEVTLELEHHADARWGLALPLGHTFTVAPGDSEAFALRKLRDLNPGFYEAVVSIHHNAPNIPSPIRFVLRAKEISGGGVPAKAYGGVPVALPGTVQMEHFDTGGIGISYSDRDTENLATNPFRTDEGVDAQIDGSRVFVGHIAANEWLNYTTAVEQTGLYDLHITYSALDPVIAAPGVLLIDIQGQEYAVELPPNQGFTSTTLHQVWLSADPTVSLQVRALSPNYRLDSVEFVRVGGDPTVTVQDSFELLSTGSGDAYPLQHTVTNDDGRLWRTHATQQQLIISSDGAVEAYLTHPAITQQDSLRGGFQLTNAVLSNNAERIRISGRLHVGDVAATHNWIGFGLHHETGIPLSESDLWLTLNKVGHLMLHHGDFASGNSQLAVYAIPDFQFDNDYAVELEAAVDGLQVSIAGDVVIGPVALPASLDIGSLQQVLVQYFLSAGTPEKQMRLDDLQAVVIPQPVSDADFKLFASYIPAAGEPRVEDVIATADNPSPVAFNFSYNEELGHFQQQFTNPGDCPTEINPTALRVRLEFPDGSGLGGGFDEYCIQASWDSQPTCGLIDSQTSFSFTVNTDWYARHTRGENGQRCRIRLPLQPQFPAASTASLNVTLSGAAVLPVSRTLSFTKTVPTQKPYENNLRPITATDLRAHQYDEGGLGVAYLDLDHSLGSFRTTGDVDINWNQTPGTGSVMTHGLDGEWLELSVSVPESAEYELDLRARRDPSAPPGAAVRVLIDGDEKGIVPVISESDYGATPEISMVIDASASSVLRFEFIDGPILVRNFFFRRLGHPPPPGDPLVIDSQPVDATALAGASVSFNVAASGGSGAPLQYQWQQFQFGGLGGFVDLVNGVGISGATTTTLQLTNINNDDAGPYRVIVSDGFQTVISDIAQLLIDPGISEVFANDDLFDWQYGDPPFSTSCGPSTTQHQYNFCHSLLIENDAAADNGGNPLPLSTNDVNPLCFDSSICPIEPNGVGTYVWSGSPTLSTFEPSDLFWQLGYADVGYSLEPLGASISDQATIRLNAVPQSVDDQWMIESREIPALITRAEADLFTNDLPAIASLSIVSLTPPAFGSINQQGGQLTYHPVNSFADSGLDTFIYTAQISQNLASRDQASVQIIYDPSDSAATLLRSEFDNNTSGWQTIADSATISINHTDPMIGTGSLDIWADQSNPAGYLQTGWPDAQTHLHSAFFIDTSNLNFVVSREPLAIEVHTLIDAKGEALANVLLRRCRACEGVEIAVAAIDRQGVIRPSDWSQLPATPHAVELEWWSASAPDVNDGGLRLVIGARVAAEVLEINNFGLESTGAQLGFIQASALLGGSFGVDLYRAWSGIRNGNRLFRDNAEPINNGIDQGIPRDPPDITQRWSQISQATRGEIGYTGNTVLDGHFSLESWLPAGTSNGNAWAIKTLPQAESDVVIRFLLNSAAFNMVNNVTGVHILRLLNIDGDLVVAVTLAQDSAGQRQLRLSAFDDSGAAYHSNLYPVPAINPSNNNTYALTLRWQSAQAAGDLRGKAQLWVDDQPALQLDSMVSAGQSILDVQLGARFVVPAHDGRIQFDNVAIDRGPLTDLLNDHFESESLSQWQQTSTGVRGNVAVSTQAALSGQFGLAAAIPPGTGLGNAWVQKNLDTPRSTIAASLTFSSELFETNNSDEAFRLLQLLDDAGNQILRLAFRNVNDQRTLRVVVIEQQNDANTIVYNSTDIPIPRGLPGNSSDDQLYQLTLNWSIDSSGNEQFQFWINGGQQVSGQITPLTSRQVHAVRMGPHFVTPDFNGEIHIDNVRIW